MVTDRRLIVVHDGGTPWWVPLAVALGVAAVAAITSYAATWWFKKRDVDRENAFRTAQLIDEAEQIATRRERYDAEGGAVTISRLLQEARVRAQPLLAEDLDDRFRAALDYVFMWGLWQPPDQEPVGARRRLGEAVANIREGLVPYLAAPRFLPVRPPVSLTRSFPTFEELRAMPHGANGQELMAALAEWGEAQGGDGS